MASTAALVQHPFSEQEVYNFPQKAREVISLDAHRKEQILNGRKTLAELTEDDLRLLSSPKQTIDLDGEKYNVVTNGQCTIEDVKQADISAVDSFKLKKLVDVHVEYPEETQREMHSYPAVSMPSRLKYLTRVFVATLLYQEPPARCWKERSKAKPKKHHGVSLKRLREKLGLTGQELLLFPGNGIVNVLSGADSDDDGVIHLNNGAVSYEKDGRFFPFGQVKEVLVTS